MATDAQQFTPIELETRPTVDTAAYAHYMHIAPQTARIHACKESGPIRPIRIPGTAKLHWPVAEIKRFLGLQAGFADALILFAIAALAILVQAFAPGLFDLTGIAMLGAGVVSGRTYIGTLARVAEIDELSKRIAKLEETQNGKF